ncbi:MAG: exodeoxyribonuclease VII large subunit [Bryobacterales bacterium]
MFDEDRKRPAALPAPRRHRHLPQRLAIADMVRILERRCPGLHIRLYPAQVQGEVAVGEIVRARCAGSARAAGPTSSSPAAAAARSKTLANEEGRPAIAECAMPVVSAVGHQTDFTIADFVADLRAPRLRQPPNWSRRRYKTCKPASAT